MAMTAELQAANIQWALIFDNLVLERKPSTGRTGYECSPAGRPDEENDLRDFARKLGSTVRAFAETERAKYPERIVLNDGKIFPDALLAFADTDLAAEHQTPAFWQQEFGVDDERAPQALIELFLRDAVPSLLYLAQNKEARIARFEWVTESNVHHFGARRILSDSLAAYILVNVHVAMGLVGDAFRSTSSFVKVRKYLTDGTDFDVHQRPHREFFCDNEELQKVERIAPYLDRLIRLMYLWDMFSTEYGKTVDWEKLVLVCLQYIWGFAHAGGSIL